MLNIKVLLTKILTAISNCVKKTDLTIEPAIRIPTSGTLTIPDTAASSPTQVGSLTLPKGSYLVRFIGQWASVTNAPSFRLISISLNSSRPDSFMIGTNMVEQSLSSGMSITQEATRFFSFDQETTIYFFMGQHTGADLAAVASVGYLKIT